MVIVYDEVNKTVRVVRNLEYRKWLKNIDLINQSAMASHNNAFEQDPVKWEVYDFNDKSKVDELNQFVNMLNSLLTNRNQS
jgi:hypothetical protein